jgi:hypothetical protein
MTVQINLDYDYQFNRRPKNKFINELIRRHETQYLEMLKNISKYKESFTNIKLTEPDQGTEPYWLNAWLPGLDAMSIYTLIAEFKPITYVEVGSGNSTKFARRAVADHSPSTKIISIDPNPRAAIDRLCDSALRCPLENLDTAIFAELQKNDVIFIDNSHRSFQNSDVTVFFTEILPAIRAGVIYGLHDIFWPEDYPVGWEGRVYNEQYILGAYLLGGAAGDHIILANHYVSSEPSPSLKAQLDLLFEDAALADVRRSGGCFWVQKS